YAPAGAGPRREAAGDSGAGDGSARFDVIACGAASGAAPAEDSRADGRVPRRLSLHRNVEALAVAAEPLELGVAVEAVLGERVAVHAVLVLRVRREEARHRIARFAGQRPAEELVDALDRRERLALDVVVRDVEELIGRREIADRKEAVERAGPAARPVRRDLGRLRTVAERAAQHRRMARH